jgi:hypothetical protein
MISGKKRGILQHLKDIKPAVMTVGGLMPRIYMVLEYHQAIESSKTIIRLLWDPVMVIGPEIVRVRLLKHLG